MRTKAQELFFELLQISTGARDKLRHTYADEDWLAALTIARYQAINGVLFSAIENLPKEQCPSREPIIRWLASADNIERFSLRIMEAGDAAVKYFRSCGFPCCILKGSSVARYYPVPSRRSSGDIDIWLGGTRYEIYDFARKSDKEGKLYGVNYHHIHYHLFDDVHLEIHIHPSYLSSPLRNYRFHRWCDMYRPTFEADAPSLAFDRVFILLHCYRHINGSGVGLRQIMDYYYVLRQGFTEDEKRDAVYWIKKLGMYRFASGLMWVLRDIFGLQSEYLLMPVDEKEGRFIFREVMLTGNMGHSDSRNWGSRKTPLSRFFFNLRRDSYLISHYPHEAFWQPFFSVWLYLWRLFKGL